MKKCLVVQQNNVYHIVNDVRVNGPHKNIRGDVNGLSGDVSGIRGNVSGIIGDVSGISGDVDEAELSEEERKNGVPIFYLIKANELYELPITPEPESVMP